MSIEAIAIKQKTKTMFKPVSALEHQSKAQPIYCVLRALAARMHREGLMHSDFVLDFLVFKKDSHCIDLLALTCGKQVWSPARPR